MKPIKIDKRKKQIVAPVGSLKWLRNVATKIRNFLLPTEAKAKLRDIKISAPSDIRTFESDRRHERMDTDREIERITAIRLRMEKERWDRFDKANKITKKF